MIDRKFIIFGYVNQSKVKITLRLLSSTPDSLYFSTKVSKTKYVIRFPVYYVIQSKRWNSGMLFQVLSYTLKNHYPKTFSNELWIEKYTEYTIQLIRTTRITKKVTANICHYIHDSNIKIAEKTEKNLASDCFTKFESETGMLNTFNVVYKINCLNCDNKYICPTESYLKTIYDY